MVAKDNVELHLRIPREVKARLVAYLIENYKPNLVPQGAQSEFITRAIENELNGRQAP